MFSIEGIQKEMEDRREARERDEAGMLFLLDMLMKTPIPEEKKGELHVIKESTLLGRAIREVTNAYADATKDVTYAERMEAAEYLNLVCVGIKNFMKVQREKKRDDTDL